MVNLLQVSVILTAVALIALGVLLYSQYNKQASNNVSDIIGIISNQSAAGNVSSGGGQVLEENGTALNVTGPHLLILNNNTDIQILQNTVNGTQYTAILFTN